MSSNKHHTTFAWNAGGGLAYAFSENVSADLGYRFIGTGYCENKKWVEGDRVQLGSSPYIHEFYLGARFTF
jgi:opacity protein-like surface antigen